MNLLSKLEKLKKIQSPWAERIISQLEYSVKLSGAYDRKFDDVIGKAVHYLNDRLAEEGAITKASTLIAESMILELSEAAKSFSILCAAHAHIDMNWQWGFAETVAITLDTFRTMLNLMKEYPEYKFSQSQAAVYKIVEEYDPEMLEEIKARVKEGRWEVTASAWVETDKNMPNGESLTRHILYTKKYLSKLLDIDPASLNIDFEPDTFGHNQNVPEILANGGVKYYYHCRGYVGNIAYKWKAPSGRSVLTYRDPLWYNSEITPSIAAYVPEYCKINKINTMLMVYGVGNHGGGPTRKDIEKLIEMKSWPVFPIIKFGTFAEFFAYLEKVEDQLPIVEHELNFICSGCFTTQTRIKAANRISEARLNEAEAFSAISSCFSGGRYRTGSFEGAWENTLFSHFHDILPGSGVIDTREYTMGKFQEILAVTNTETSLALRNIASRINSSGLIKEEDSVKDLVSDGAGVGYGVKDFVIPQVERGRGKGRIFHFFNPSASERTGVTEITVWDWPGDKARLEFRDGQGQRVMHQFIDNYALENSNEPYWNHTYIRLLAEVSVPAFGYSTYYLTEGEKKDSLPELTKDPRVETREEYILENDLVRVAFNKMNAAIISLVDKVSCKEMIDVSKSVGIFRIIEEDDSHGRTAWFVGRYMNISYLDRDVKIGTVHMDRNALRQWISYEIPFRSSRLKVTVTLEKNNTWLDYNVECDWQEIAKPGSFIPQLNFQIPAAYKCSSYKYDIPFGTIIRDNMDMDVPATSWIAGMPEDGSNTGLMLVTGTKYGFRGMEDSIAVTLIRSSYDPDPYPENGIHKFKFAVGLVSRVSNKELINKAYNYNHPISYISSLEHKGTQPLSESFIKLESGDVVLSAIKMPEENGKGKMILRVYETEGKRTQVEVMFAKDIVKAWFVDANEKAINNVLAIDIKDDKISFYVDANSISNVCVEL